MLVVNPCWSLARVGPLVVPWFLAWSSVLNCPCFFLGPLFFIVFVPSSVVSVVACSKSCSCVLDQSRSLRFFFDPWSLVLVPWSLSSFVHSACGFLVFVGPKSLLVLSPCWSLFLGRWDLVFVDSWAFGLGPCALVYGRLFLVLNTWFFVFCRGSCVFFGALSLVLCVRSVSFLQIWVWVFGSTSFCFGS